MSSAHPIYEDDEINLREILKALLRYKWVILATGILLAVAVFLVAKLLLPKEYQATAYLIITKPITTTNLDPRIQTVPQLPDSKSITDLTRTDDLVEAVLKSPEVSALFVEQISTQSLKDLLSVALVGNNQLRLTVSDTNPQRAATIANAWAVLTVARLNSLFGTDTTSLTTIEAQVEEARQAWDTAEQALLAYLPNSDLNSLQTSLNQAQTSLQNILSDIDTLDTIISDAQTLRARLQTQDAANPVAFGDSLSLISLQQQAAGKLQGFQIQITGLDIAAEYTVRQMLKDVDTFITTLQNQRGDFQTRADQKRAEITTLTTDLESAQYQLDQLTIQRDIKKQSYSALSNQVAEIQISIAQNDQVAKVAGQALPPVKASGPRTLLYTAIAGAAGLFISAMVILLWIWWKTPTQPVTVKASGQS